MIGDVNHLNPALHRAWDEISARTYLHAGKPTLTAEEVREAVYRRVAAEPAANEHVVQFLALPEPEKRRALAAAFPDGPYSAKTQDDELQDDVLTD